MLRKGLVLFAVLALVCSIAVAGDLVELKPVGAFIKGPVVTNELDQWEDLFQVRRFSDPTAEYYLGSGSLADTMCVVFQPLTACSIYVGQIQWFNAGNYQAFIWDYNEAAGALGRAPNRGTSPESPLGDVLFGPFANTAEGTQEWEEMFTPDDLPDGGIERDASMFVVGFVKTQDDGLPQPLANDESSRRFTYTWFGGPWMNAMEFPWGAYSGNIATGTVIDIMMRILVNYTQNPPPIIQSMSQLPNTINTEKVCMVESEIYDNNGWTTDWANLNVSVNHGEPDVIPMTDPDADGVFTADFDLADYGVVLGDNIYYWITAADDEGMPNTNVDDQRSFEIIELTNPNSEMLVVSDGMSSSLGDRLNVLLTYLDNNFISYELYDVESNKGIDEFAVDGGTWHTIFVCGWGTLMPTREYMDGPFGNAVVSGINFILSDMDYFYGNDEDELPTFAAGDLAYDLFGIESGSNDPVPTDSMFYGEAGDVLSGNWVDDPYIIKPNLYSGDWADFVIPNAQAIAIFTGSELGNWQALRRDIAGQKSAYFAFDIFSNCYEDSLYYPDDDYWEYWLAPTEDFNQLMDNLMSWFEVGQITHMSIDLRGNYFELTSTYIIPPSLSALDVFTISDLAIVYQDDGRIYIPNLVNTIGNINLTEGYQIFCYQPSNWSVIGDLVDPTMVFSLQSNRWNWLAYPFDHPIPVTTALSEIAGRLTIIQNDMGRLWIPGLINTLGNMAPGEGYFTFVSQTLTFQYNAGGGLAASLGDEVCDIPEVEGAPLPTGLPYAVLVRMTDNLQSHQPSEVELYDGNLLVGKALVLEDRELTPVIAWRGSEEYNLAGYVEGHPITIKVKSANSEIATTYVGQGAVFGEGAYADVTLDANAKALPTEFSVKSAYPNPFNPATTIPFAVPVKGELTFTVYNILGQQIFNQTRVYEAGYYNFLFDANLTENELVSGMYFMQIQYNGQVSTQKVMLLK